MKAKRTVILELDKCDDWTDREICEELLDRVERCALDAGVVRVATEKEEADLRLG